MRPALLFACAALWLGAVAPLAADECFTIRFLDRHRARLGVVGEKARAVRSVADYDWTFSRAVGVSIPIRVIEPEKWRGYYLAYNPQAKGKEKGAVLLAKKDRPGTEWVLTRVKEKGAELYTLQADSGTVKGWYLDVAEEGEVVNDYKGEATAYRVFLSEKPKKVPRWVFTVIGR